MLSVKASLIFNLGESRGVGDHQSYGLSLQELHKLMLPASVFKGQQAKICELSWYELENVQK